MNCIAKFLTISAFAAAALAMTAAPSEARGKGMMKMKPGSWTGQTCSAPGQGGLKHVMWWGADKKWYTAAWPVCATPFCPPSC